MWNRQWSCSMPVVRFNSQERVEIGSSSRDSRKWGHNSCSSNAHKLYHYMQSAKLSQIITRQSHIKNSNGRSSAHTTIVGELILLPLADSRIQFTTNVIRRATLLRYAVAKDQTRTKYYDNIIYQIHPCVATDDNCNSDTSESYKLYNLQESCVSH